MYDYSSCPPRTPGDMSTDSFILALRRFKARGVILKGFEVIRELTLLVQK